MLLSKIAFTGASILLLSGILCVALAAALFKDSDFGKTQDVHGVDPVKRQHHWPILWAGAIQFGVGILLCLMGGAFYLLEKL